MIRFLATPSPEEIFTNPLRWAGKHLAFYGAAALVAGTVFVAGAAIYSHLTPPLEIPPAAVSAEPATLEPGPVAPAADPSGEIAAAPSGTTTAYASSPPISASKTIGAAVVDGKNTTIGQIKDFTVSATGQTSVTVKTTAGSAVSLPADAFYWSDHGSSVRAIVKPKDIERFRY